jgi:cytochrome c556
MDPMPRQTKAGQTMILAAGGAVLLALVASIGIRAQQPPGGGGAAARPPIPMAASSIALNPDAHYGENVAMTATVEQQLSKTAFSVDQDAAKSTGKDVLIIAPYLSAAVTPNKYVHIVGEVFKFDPAELAKKAKDYTLDLPSDVVAKYTGKPAVIASSVITAELADIGKRQPPPMTAAEEAFDKTMKSVSGANTALRKGIEESSVELTKQQAAILKKGFMEAQLFFKNRNTTDAVGWAQDAYKFVDTIEQAATAGKWDEVKTAAGSLAQMCSTCHGVHRERFDDGTFRVRSSR